MIFKKKHIAIVSLAILTNVILWELIFRLFIGSPCTQIFDKEIGYRNKPYSYNIQSMEGFSKTRFNSLGFNDFEPFNNIDSKNIFIVGDSYTEAFQVSKNESYAQVAEDLLNRNTDKRTDIIKLCRDGFKPIHYPTVIKRYYNKYKPEAIIVQFGYHTVYDLYSKEISASYSNDDKIKSLKFNLRTEDRQKELFRVYINNSSLLYSLIKKYKGLIMNYLKIFKKNKNVSVNSIRKSRKTFDDMVKRFEYMADEIMKNDTNLIFLYFPKPGSYMSSNNESESLSLEVVRHVAENKKIKLIQFDNEFKSVFSDTRRPLNGFANSLPGEGHLNALGHRVVGEKLANYLSGLK